MKLCVSALAWPAEFQNEALNILKQYQVSFIELVPFRIKDVNFEVENLKKQGLQPLAFQALLFGTENLHLFETDHQRNLLLEHLTSQCVLASKLGVKNLIFGSPKNRSFDEKNWTKEEAETQAIQFFKTLGQKIENTGAVICLEPNPAIYGTNFLTHSLDTYRFVEKVNHPAIRMNLDLGAVTLNQENLSEVWDLCSDAVSHIHISEPQLMPIGTSGKAPHAEYGKFFKSLSHHPVLSVEVKSSEQWKESLISSLECTRELYG